MRNHLLLTAGILLASTSVHAQQLRDGYVVAGSNTGSEQFHTLLNNWTPGGKVSEDDNFYISRVKPHYRFRNQATQVRSSLTPENDKKLIAWLPFGDPAYNALPNGLFDSEVFSMWSYVTHWGNWSASLGRIPAALLDVAHKNGVGVSGVAGIPYGYISYNYSEMLNGLASSDVDNDAKFLSYYGIDGLGYNSEFSDYSGVVESLQAFHGNLVKKMRQTDSLFTNFWYDGTNDQGQISFDRGLGGHNQENFGDSANIRTSLFLNYNWNKTSLMNNSVTNAEEMGRDPLDLYCGVNMQGGEPAGTSWSLLPNYRLSIGLWGAHTNNMFWEGRGEKGSEPAVKQATYLQRIERYFTGGTRNPANCPEIVDGHNHSADNFSWHGMSTFMTARSALSWNLSEEPFITYFNLGNGTFFNLKGKREYASQWYNIGMQDYLPTWRWWFADKLLGNNAADVPASGLDANFTWDDAWFGGSSLRLSGSTADEYLHLFKTKYALANGDKVTFRYKLAKGSADVNLLLSAEGQETQPVELKVLDKTTAADEEEWIEKTFTVGEELAGKTLALIALRVKDAADLNLLLGELSVVRETAATPQAPELTSASMLYNSKSGMDGKVIFNMPNDKAAGEPCYNIDVNTSYFKLYAQEEGGDPVFMGATTSWAGLMFSVPVTNPNAKVRLGVAAVSLDHKSQSEISWSDYMEPASYIYSDDIQIDKTTIKPNEKFTMEYADPQHEEGTWTLTDSKDSTVFSATGRSVTVEEGLKDIGSYNLTVIGVRHEADGTVKEDTTVYGNYVQITSEAIGALPEIYTLTANGEDKDITIQPGEAVTMRYTGRHADGAGSQGVDLKEQRFGAKCADLGIVGRKSFSIAFWLKINELADGETQFVSVADKSDSWPKTDWGWIWTTINPDGTVPTFTFRGTDATSNNELRYKYDQTKIPVGTWTHFVLTFDYDANGGFKSAFYMNGVEQKLSRWNRAQSEEWKTTDPGYQPNVYNITSGQVIAVGGSAHGRSGIKGALDNLQIWDKAITAEEVKLAMGDIDTNNMPQNLEAFWDFEDKASEDHTFSSVGSKPGVAAGSHSYLAGGGEGQGTFQWQACDYTSGCPFISGRAFQVTTLPTWHAPKAVITDATGNSEAGQAKLTYDRDGVREVTLTLANSLGSDQKTFSLITIRTYNSIASAETANELKAYSVDRDVVVEFADAGNYTVSVYTTDGRAAASRSAALGAGQTMRLTLPNSGVYVLRVAKDGKTVKTMKLIRK